jgi:hypothetical protein
LFDELGRVGDGEVVSLAELDTRTVPGDTGGDGNVELGDVGADVDFVKKECKVLDCPLFDFLFAVLEALADDLRFVVT